MIFSAKTDIGLRRSSNQDAFSFKKIGDDFGWSVVCDGMGGMAAGNLASEIAVKHIEKSFNDNLSPKLSEKQILNLIKASVESANSAIFDKAKNDEKFNGMGTTIVLAVVKGSNCYVAHAGDSRLYRFSNGKLSQVTTDHSVVQSMVDIGHITEAEAKLHPNKNIITKALGVHSNIDVDITCVSVCREDIVLLCTDGLTNCVSDAEINNILQNTGIEGVADELVDKANAGGGLDNITAVALKI